MKKPSEVKLDVPSRATLDKLACEAPPHGMRATPLVRVFHRDIYLDSRDKTLEDRGVCCRLRTRSDDRRLLSLEIRSTAGGGAGPLSRRIYEAAVREVDFRDVVRGASGPARRLRAIIDPDRLEPTIELEVERRQRRCRAGWVPLHLFELVYDAVTIRGGDASETLFELKIRHLRRGQPSLEQVVQDLQHRYGLRTMLSGKTDRARRHLAVLESRALSRDVHDSREVALLATHQGQIAMRRAGNSLVLPVEQGNGEETCRSVLRAHLGTVEAEVRLLGAAAAAAGTRPVLEVWLADRLPESVVTPRDERVKWFTPADVMARVGSPLVRDARTLAALAVANRSDLFHLSANRAAPAPEAPALSAPSDVGTQTIADLQSPALPEESLDAWEPVPDQFINEQLSWLEFNTRVLELAEDPGTPLLARFRFLAIFSTNLDEFVMVRIGLLKQAVVEGVAKTTVDGLAPHEELDAISVRLGPLVERQQRCFRRLLPELERHGVALRKWEDLDPRRQDAMRSYFDEQIFPVLTPQAMTRAPGHPFPHIANLSLSLAAMVRDEETGPVHFAQIRVPGGIPRFVPLPDGTAHVPVEEIIKANIGALYPGRLVEGVNAFRVTRSGDISVDEEAAFDLLQAIEEEVKRRPFGAVVRIEVEQSMPHEMRTLLERELQFEESAAAPTLSAADTFESDWMVDLSALHELASLPLPHLDYPAFSAAVPLDRGVSIFDQIAAKEILVHHPYDAFDATVERFILEAVDDPAVVSIKLMLYRSGDQSRIVDGLGRAARAGKEVAVFVELKARFDEERNIHWAKKLEQDGIHVVYGLVRLKTHAKTTLVVRREGDSIRRYVHIGTGNYNAATAKHYTDLGLLSCRQKLGADLSDLFNELTGSSRPPQSKFNRLLVAPKRMRKRFLKLIEREAEHARTGRGGAIRVKLNGIADKEIIGSLYSASQAGVEIDLIVRGICALRPGVPGLSDRIRVISILGRFLEHARIYHFANAGEPEYYIGSADWRRRNLRRRVEVVAPVVDGDACQRLNEILDRELDDPFAWHMNSDGSYSRRQAPIGVDQQSAQEYWVERLA